MGNRRPPRQAGGGQFLVHKRLQSTCAPPASLSRGRYRDVAVRPGLHASIVALGATDCHDALRSVHATGQAHRRGERRRGAPGHGEPRAEPRLGRSGQPRDRPARHQGCRAARVRPQHAGARVAYSPVVPRRHGGARRHQPALPADGARRRAGAQPGGLHPGADGHRQRRGDRAPPGRAAARTRRPTASSSPPPGGTTPLSHELADANVPAVLVNRNSAAHRLPYVGCDERTGVGRGGRPPGRAWPPFDRPSRRSPGHLDRT